MHGRLAVTPCCRSRTFGNAAAGNAAAAAAEAASTSMTRYAASISGAAASAPWATKPPSTVTTAAAAAVGVVVAAAAGAWSACILSTAAAAAGCDRHIRSPIAAACASVPGGVRKHRPLRRHRCLRPWARQAAPHAASADPHAACGGATAAEPRPCTMHVRRHARAAHARMLAQVWCLCSRRRILFQCPTAQQQACRRLRRVHCVISTPGYSVRCFGRAAASRLHTASWSQEGLRGDSSHAPAGFPA
mmetsp:Transcript_462/g.1243  ORF Transcript_462/g.1243 Transcript_462/m.1243 type:complete len:247 (+) Transcript_462:738-1478(+)